MPRILSNFPERKCEKSADILLNPSIICDTKGEVGLDKAILRDLEPTSRVMGCESEGMDLGEKEGSQELEQAFSANPSNYPEPKAGNLQDNRIFCVAEKVKERQKMIMQDLIACQNDPNHVSTLDERRRCRLGEEFSLRKWRRDREFRNTEKEEGYSRKRPRRAQASLQAEDDMLLCRVREDLTYLGRRRAIRLLALLDKEKEAKGELDVQAEQIRGGLQQYIVAQAMVTKKVTSKLKSSDVQHPHGPATQDFVQQVDKRPKKPRRAKPHKTQALTCNFNQS